METKNWEWFRIGDLFSVELSKGDIKYNQANLGNVPLVSAGKTNNGIIGFIDSSGDGIAEVFEGNKITIDMFCNVYYQKNSFYAVSHGRVNILIPKFKLTKYNALFILTIISRDKYKYSYGRAVYSSESAEIRIKLPTKNSKVDWDWIENFVKEIIIPKLPKKSFAIWNNEQDTSPVINQKYSLNTENWKWFNYDKLFQIKGSRTTPIQELKDIHGLGKYPYITTQAVNNGVEGYFDFHTEDGNVFTVDSAVLGYCAYQTKKFSASDHVEKLIPKFKCNIYIAMFIVTLINREQYRYNYGRKCSQTKLKRSKIKLPAGKDGEPDFDFMENYIKSLPYSKMI